MLDGGDDDDTLEGGAGADVSTGGDGEDTASYLGSAAGVIVRLHAMQALGGHAEGDVFAGTDTNMYTVLNEDREEVEMTETVPDIVHLTGSTHDDILAGDTRDNNIVGGEGNDRLYGGPGGSHDDSDNHDSLWGGAGDDHLFGGKGRDNLIGNAGDDTMTGGSGADLFWGEAGSDTIFADRRDLEDGWIDGHTNLANYPAKNISFEKDTLSFAKFTDQALEEDGMGIYLNLSGVVVQATDTGPVNVLVQPASNVRNIDTIIGTAEGDILIGSDSAPETIEGGDDGDHLRGGSGPGDNVFREGNGPGDTVSYASSDRGVRVRLGDGTTDETTGSTASRGHATGDVISGFENVTGSAHDDRLTALVGVLTEGGSWLKGLDGDDVLKGGLGNDTLEGGAGADELDGGFTPIQGRGQNHQTNTLSYANSDAGVTVNLLTVTASGGHADGDEIETYSYIINPGTDSEAVIEVATFEDVTGSDHDDHLTGDRFFNTLVGNDGDDTLRGGESGDYLNGGKGADMLDGGSATGEDRTLDGWNLALVDWAVYWSAEAAVTVNMATGRGESGEAEGDILKNIEVVIGSSYGDTFIAGPGPDVFHGNSELDNTVSYRASKYGVNVNLATDSNIGYWDLPDDVAEYDHDGNPDTPPKFRVRDLKQTCVCRFAGW